jgi:hypothetical protein
MITPFVIFGLPRSRTTWLSRFLTYGPWVCCHDALLSLDSVAGLRELLSLPETGLCETGMSFAAPLIRRYFPNCRFVVVRRPLADIEASLSRSPGWEGSRDYLAEEEKRLEAISAMPGTLTVTFDQLNGMQACQEVFEHCLQLPFDEEWWAALAPQDIQIDMAASVARSVERTPQMAALMAEAARLLAPVTIQEESWEAVLRDGQELFAAHYAEADPFPGFAFDPDYGLVGTLAAGGWLQIMTARAAGKMVGYLFFTLEPSIACRSLTFAAQNVFFVHKAFRGATGLRLHRAAVRALKARGDIYELVLRAGVVASGPKLASLFRRMGAADYGHLFRLRMED